jgi:hypothetical protein
MFKQCGNELKHTRDNKIIANRPAHQILTAIERPGGGVALFAGREMEGENYRKCIKHTSKDETIIYTRLLLVFEVT